MKILSIAFAVLGLALVPLAQAGVKNIVLVHGAFADGSGGSPVAAILEHDGYTVYVVQKKIAKSIPTWNDSWPAEPNPRQLSSLEAT